MPASDRSFLPRAPRRALRPSSRLAQPFPPSLTFRLPGLSPAPDDAARLQPLARAVRAAAAAAAAALGTVGTVGTVGALAVAGAAHAQEAAPPASDAVVVTGALRAMRTLDLPFAVTSVEAETVRGAGPMINLSEALSRVPGLVVNNRSNYAQDLQISSRGFGARTPFGVRGLRIYTDGIPATMPDGQGQVGHVDLAGAQRIEVLRGPFSVLYGNSSGGVISVFGAPVRAAQTEAALDLGSFGLRQERLALALPLGGGLDLRGSVSHMDLSGFRPHSVAQRDLGNLRLGWQGGRDTVVATLSHHAQQAEDPLGLTRAEWDADPRQTNALAFSYNTRKSLRQTQAGAVWRHDFGDAGVLRESSLAGYAGNRSVTGFQAITPAAQTPASSGGGVVAFDRRYGGVEGRLNWQFGAVEMVTGLDLEDQLDDRRGYENYTGTGAAQQLGVQGRQRRDETNRASSLDGFVQLKAPLAQALTLTGGLRGGRVQLRADDHYLGNGDDSGDLRFHYLNPVLGLQATLQPGWTLHASAARGFESPTLSELAYRASGGGGFNSALQPQTSRQLELGSKWRSRTVQADVALFQADTANEIAVLTNSGGRSVYQNVGSTRRRGLELSAQWQLLPTLRVQASATWLQAAYRDAFLTCTASPCTVPTVAVAAGNRIAGTTGRVGQAELAWRPGPEAAGELALELRGVGRTVANDTNTQAAGGHALANLRWRGTVPLGQADALELLARVDNLFDRAHIASVIVNEGNQRYFETGAPRSALLSLRWLHRW